MAVAASPPTDFHPPNSKTPDEGHLAAAEEWPKAEIVVQMTPDVFKNVSILRYWRRGRLQLDGMEGASQSVCYELRHIEITSAFRKSCRRQFSLACDNPSRAKQTQSDAQLCEWGTVSENYRPAGSMKNVFLHDHQQHQLWGKTDFGIYQ
jgi:hypothetical protein